MAMLNRMKNLPLLFLLSNLLLSNLLLSNLAWGQARPDVAAVMKRGAQLVASGRSTEAQSLYEQALRTSPDDPDLRFGLGTVFFRERKWPQAVENLRSSINARPGSVKVLYYLAEAFFMEADVDRARQTMAMAATLAPEDAQVCQRYGEYLIVNIESRKEGLAWMEKARRLDPMLPRVDFDVARTHFDLTDYQSAIPDFEAALKRDPGNGEAAFYLAESWANLGEWGKARDFYSYATTHHYEKGPAFYGLGRAYVELGAFEVAIAPLQRAIVLDPSVIRAHFQLAKAFRQLGRTKEAQEETRLFEAMSDRVDTSGQLQGSEEQQAWKQAKPLLEANQEQDALKLLAKLPAGDGPGHEEPHYLLGTMYYSLGRNDDAKRVLTVARSQAPKSARIAAYLGMVQLSGGDASAAENSFQSALALDSTETLALIGMGGIRYQQQRWPETIDYLEKSRTADPHALFLLCDAYYRVGKPEQAALMAEVVRAFGADQKPLLAELDKLIETHTR
jgi:tetratricopeptide (TPR) repeat protein